MHGKDLFLVLDILPFMTVDVVVGAVVNGPADGVCIISSMAIFLPLFKQIIIK